MPDTATARLVARHQQIIAELLLYAEHSGMCPHSRANYTRRFDELRHAARLLDPAPDPRPSQEGP